MIELYKLNLQMFADANVQTTALNTTGNDLSPEMKTYYDMKLIDYAEPDLVHKQFGEPHPIPSGGGKTIEMRRFSPLSKVTTALQEGVVPSGGTINTSALTATVLQYGHYIAISDMLDLAAIDPVFERTVRALASQAARSLDTLVRDELAGGDQVMYSPYISGDTVTAVTDRSEITANSMLTVDDILEAAAELQALNAPKINGEYVAIIHPYTKLDLMKSQTWRDSVKYTTSDKIFNGEIGTIGGVRFVESSEAKVIAPSPICAILPNRYALQTLLDADTGSVDIKPNATIAAADATAINAAITAGAVYKIYVGGTEGTVASVTAGAAGTCKITVGAAIKNKAVGTVICGEDAGADGSAVFMTLVLGSGAYGITEITGGGLQTIIKPKTSGGTSNPLDQYGTAGWKTTHVSKRLVEEYMIRIEHGTSKSATTESN